jgi:hypothetical protein
MKGKNSQNRIARKAQPVKDGPDRTGRKERTARTRHSGDDRQDRAIRHPLVEFYF